MIAKLTDFGIATKKEFDTTGMPGTPRYLALEILKKELKAVSRMAEIFFGVVIWECLSCEKPTFNNDNSRSKQSSRFGFPTKDTGSNIKEFDLEEEQAFELVEKTVYCWRNPGTKLRLLLYNTLVKSVHQF